MLTYQRLPAPSLHYDDPGAMSVLGPRVWHDVPPLMRVDAATAPVRVTLTLRFAP